MKVTAAGLATVAKQEFRLRIRTGRWRWLLAIWFAVVTGFAALVRLGLAQVGETDHGRPAGPPLFGSVMLFVLGLALLVAPALTSQSVNGDRERGTLATVQVTLLTAAELALGKLAAAWCTALVFLALTLPVVVWAMAEGGLPLGKVLVTLLVVALLLGVVCALAQALSALLARTVASSLLSYLTVFVLTVGTLIAFGIGAAVSTQEQEVTVQNPDGSTTTYSNHETRTDRVWPLLAPNPFVVLADAAPRLAASRDPVTGERQRPLDPLGSLGEAVREARRGPVHCFEEGVALDDTTPGCPARPGPVWPFGLAFDLALGAGAAVVTARRLGTPRYRLARGVRVA